MQKFVIITFKTVGASGRVCLFDGTPWLRRCGCVSSGGPISQVRFGTGCDLHSVRVRVGPAPGAPPGPGRHGQPPGESESDDSVGRRRRGAAGRCARYTDLFRCDAEDGPARTGPAGRLAHHHRKPRPGSSQHPPPCKSSAVRVL